MITVASKLSGTYQSACLAAEDYPEISVVDSETVAVGTHAGPGAVAVAFFAKRP